MRKLILSYILLAAAGLAAGFILFGQKKAEQATSQVHFACPISEEAVASAYPAEQEKASGVKAIIVNHHLLGRELIAANLARVATAEPATVVIISPNHFNAGDSAIITSKEDWDTCYGKIQVDRRLVKVLEGKNIVAVEEKPFDSEHGIYNLLPFIRHSFPNAKVVPLLVKETAGDKLLSDLSTALASEIGNNGLIIGSFDFSHEVTSEIADKQDILSIEAIKSGDPAQASRVAIDSKKGLYLIMDYAKKIGADRFTLTGNTNAAKLLKKPDMTDVTSYVTGYFSNP